MKFILALIFSLSIALSTFAATDEKPLAKNFIAPALDGQTINLSEQRGKVVILTFWSTSCPICAAELPKLSQVVNKNAGKKVVFLALTMENENRVSSFMRKRPFSSIIIPNSLGILMDYAPKDSRGNYNLSFPSYFVINQAGEIEMKMSGRDKIGAIDSQINQLLTNRQ